MRDTDIQNALKDELVELWYLDSGIPKDNVGSANALHLNGYSDRKIQKMWMWKISECLAQFSLRMFKAMKKDFQFVNIAHVNNPSSNV